MTSQLPSVQSLGQELPGLVATLHSDMRQVVRDLETLAKVHSAAADIAPVCGQVGTLVHLVSTILHSAANPTAWEVCDSPRCRGATAP